MSTFWGKLNRDKETHEILEFLSLADHCLDVAMVFRELCNLPSVRRIFNCAAETRLNAQQLDRLAVFAFAHDLGKCNWGFQAKKDLHARTTASHILETLPLFFDASLSRKFFQIFKCDLLIKWFDDPESVFRLFLASLSHHGRPAFTDNDGVSLNTKRAVKFWKPNENIDPMDGLKKLFEKAYEVFPAAFDEKVEPIKVTKTLQHRFAGLVMLSDWLGSHSEAFFPFRRSGNRIDWSHAQAQKALKAVGLDTAPYLEQFRQQLPTFSSIFCFDPYPLQARLSSMDLPPLLIAESDTGSGKTEAALIHFLSLFEAGEVDSLYFALPTRVAARELYDRVLNTMLRAFGEKCPPVLLAVPGYVRIDGEPVHALPSEDRLFFEDKYYRDGRLWASERPKRFLAAPVAVGTIDQALLSAIRVNHAHLRMICLDRSLLVIDEVHSSDVYMRALSRHMIAEHLRVGGRALLLSATLGSAAREEYLHLGDLPCPASFRESVELPYPSLTAIDFDSESLTNPACRPKRLILDRVLKIEEPKAVLPRIEKAASEGSRVLVVLNTVKRAIDLFRAADSIPALRGVLFSCNGVSCPHHGRFAKPDRQALDIEVTRLLGKGSPLGPLVLIGTQTLEQSLDIDADWLITDLCPMDVLLQRIGRLHRHDRGQRPGAVCTILLPETNDLGTYLSKNGEVRYGAPAGLGSVYEDLRILQLTRDIISSAEVFNLPDDNRKLVEGATHPEKIGSLDDECWLRHGQYIEGKIQAMLMAANGAVIPRADFGDFSFPASLDTQLMTRLGLDDRRIYLGSGYSGPFGSLIEELDIPGHMARGLEKETADSVDVSPEGLLIRAGQYCYRYSRFGLEKIDEPAHG